MNIVVLSNCTHATIARFLRFSGHFRIVRSFAPFDLAPDRQEQVIKHLDAADAIISLPHANNWGVFSRDALTERYGDKVHFFPVPYFSGLHPDVLYVNNAAGKRSQSPLGDYHSAMLFYGYSTGLSVETVTRLWTHGPAPEFLNIRDNWMDGIAALAERERDCHVKISDIIDETCRQQMGMLTVNHPGPTILSRIAHRTAMSVLKREIAWYDPETVYYSLARAPVIPLYTQVKETMGLPFNSQALFQTAPGDNPIGAALPFRTLAARSYRLYDATRFETLTPHSPAPLAQRLRDAIAAAQ